MLGKTIVALASLTMAASPCGAQMQDFDDLGAFRGGASVGAYFRLPLTREAGRPARVQMGFRISAVRSHRDSFAPAGPVYESEALDLRVVGSSKPTLLVAGRPLSGLPKDRLNLGTGETVAIAAGGVAVLLLLAVAAGGGGLGDTCPTIEGRRDHCINP